MQGFSLSFGLHSWLGGGWGLRGGGYFRECRLGVHRKGSQALTLLKDEANENRHKPENVTYRIVCTT